MTHLMIPERIQQDLEDFLKKNRKADLISAYLFYLEKKFHLNPIVFMREKKIYKNEEDLIRNLELNNKLYRETEIKIQVGRLAVNELTKKIYICPYSGKVFGDNTHPNPQDAIYDWVSKCPENTDRVDGVRVKKFYISEDPEVIKNYQKEAKASVKKTVYTSVITGKLFHNKQSIIDDLLENHVQHIPLKDVPSQNRFELQENFLEFIREHLEESKISAFVETLSNYDTFNKYIEKWTGE